mmetsp:Transcript_86241/g.172620  ORF Transcript_86241/g.172620 Transcript_86241/m.172620 type:complete len:291 (-) Transcript_86241:163-1035(-)
MKPTTLMLLHMLMAPLAATFALAPLSPQRVLVTGAAGQTGSLVLKLLETMPDRFQAVGLVRTEESRAKLPATSEVVVASIEDEAALGACLEGVNGLIICTSATPAPTGEMSDGRPVFGFPNGQPERVDWLGQKHQIDAAKACGSVRHVVVCGSMGGTNPGNMLNSIGKKEGDPKSGNILLWKRKAEQYLIQSGLDYTIVHPGGLVNEEGGRRELVAGVDDGQEGTDNKNIPRGDVAAVLVASLKHPTTYRNRAFDVRSKAEGEGAPTADFAALLDRLEGANCDYTLGEIP